MTQINEEWKKFLFMGTHFNGYVRERKHWDSVVSSYKNQGYDRPHLLKAKMFKLENEEAPAFAFRDIDSVTLGEWAEQNGMNLFLDDKEKILCESTKYTIVSGENSGKSGKQPIKLVATKVETEDLPQALKDVVAKLRKTI